jgi:hypothetical protein
MIVPALEPMCYVDDSCQVAVPALSVTSLFGGPTSGSSSSRMPSSTRRWISVAEYSRQGRGSGTRFENIFVRVPELLDADPNSSLKWLWNLPVDSSVLYYVYSTTLTYFHIAHSAFLPLVLQVPVGTAVDPELVGSPDRIHDNPVNGLDQDCNLKWTGSDLKTSVSLTKL